jgi:HK97 family phage portal protein
MLNNISKIASALKASLSRLTGEGRGEGISVKSTSNWDRPYRSDSSTPAKLTNAYQQSVWVYAAVRTLAESVANIPFVLTSLSSSDLRASAPLRDTSSFRRRSPDDLIQSGPAHTLLQRPNPQMDKFAFWEILVTWLMLRGKVAVAAVDSLGNPIPLTPSPVGRERAGVRVSQLVIIPPDRLRPIVDRHELLGYQYTPGVNDPRLTSSLLPNEILLIRLPNIQDIYDGQSPLAVAQIAAETDYASALFMQGTMKNNADTGLIVKTDQTLSDEQREAMFAAIRARKRGGGAADRPLILESGLDVTKPTISSADLQYLENRKFNRQEICAVFGVPQDLLGFSEDANRSVGESSRLNFIENRVLPLCRRLESALQPLIAALGPYQAWFDCDDLPVMQSARRARVDTATKLWTLGVPFNDINDLLDLGFPEYPWHEIGYLPFSVSPAVGSSLESPESPASLPSPANNTPDTAEALDALQDSLSRLASTSRPAPRAPLPAACCSHLPQHDATLSARARLKTGKLRRYFWEQRTRVLAALENSTLGKSASSPLSASAPLREPSDPSSAATHHSPLTTHRSSIADIFNEPDETRRLLAALKPALLADLEYAAGQLWQELGVPAEFSLPPEKAITFLQSRSNMISGINQTTFRKIQDELSAGLSAGETQQELQNRLKAVFNHASDFRAETIANTETQIALGKGRFIGMEEAGVEKKQWLTSNLENVRASHLDAEQRSLQGIPLDEPFSNGLMHPGDPSGPADEVINCRCTMVAVLPEKGLTSKQFPANPRNAL